MKDPTQLTDTCLNQQQRDWNNVLRHCSCVIFILVSLNRNLALVLLGFVDHRECNFSNVLNADDVLLFLEFLEKY